MHQSRLKHLRTAVASAGIGFTVAILISVFAPLTQAGWNPARDLGPRIVAFALGWGPIAIPGPRWEVLVYVVGPLAGGPLGAWLYDRLLRPVLQPVPPVGEEHS
ncbi:MAG: aquaporin [Chloroflexi bacterium]|nr:aquaporin [Chloroflexota bacterium]